MLNTHRIAANPAPPLTQHHTTTTRIVDEEEKKEKDREEEYRNLKKKYLPSAIDKLTSLIVKDFLTPLTLEKAAKGETFHFKLVFQTSLQD